jgi:hypothetical protein
MHTNLFIPEGVAEEKEGEWVEEVEDILSHSAKWSIPGCMLGYH